VSDADAGRVEFRRVPAETAARAARGWWDGNATQYLAEHGEFLGPADFVWCPEGLREADAGLLGEVRGLRTLEVGSGAAQRSRWLVAQGAEALAVDLSGEMLAAARELDERTGVAVPSVQADARALPLADASIDMAFTAFGAIPFVADAEQVHAEVARVLRPGGRWVFAVTHPVRWAFPDDPGQAGLTAFHSYFDRRPYVEHAADGSVAYTEHHRTVADHVGQVLAAGFVLDGLVEPEWPEWLESTWGGWGPVRGALLPGTLIVRSHRPAC
jgi:ubiquinone/menaquinone biosynthesis C-methylase UbiE